MLSLLAAITSISACQAPPCQRFGLAVEGFRRLPFSQIISQNIGGDAAKPIGKTAALGVERANAPDGHQPSFLDDVVGPIAQPGAAPTDESVQAWKGILVPGLPGFLVAGQHGKSHAALAPDAVAQRHHCASTGFSVSSNEYCRLRPKSF